MPDIYSQCCPNLRFESIETGTDEGLDLEMLLEGLEEEFDLPAISVDTSDGGSPKAKVIGEKPYLPLVLVIPDRHPAQRPGVLQMGLVSGETDDLVGKDIGSLGRGRFSTTSYAALLLRRVTKKTPALFH